jgi:formyl-CoA transferase
MTTAVSAAEDDVTIKPEPSAGPLAGLRVLEIGHFVAAPFCTRLLGDLGAEIVKIELPSGDPVRLWGAQVDGHSPWWAMHGRNKKSVTLNLKHPKAVDTILRLAELCDVVVENFRPGQLERMGMGDEALRRHNPALVIAHISGFGQDGPYRDRAAFGVIGEAIGGLRHLTNYPPGKTGLPPVRVGVSIGDSIAGLYAAFGIMAALWRRPPKGSTLDVALTESILSMMEGMLPEYGALGTVRQPTGSAIATAAPSNAYKTADEQWILIAANSDPLFRRLARLLDKEELADDPRFANNHVRVQNAEELDCVIAAWTAVYPASHLSAVLNDADIPSTLVYTAKEIAEDPQYLTRGAVATVADPFFGTTLQVGVVPRVVENPGSIRWSGPSIGEHTTEVLSGWLNYTAAEIADLREQGVV